MNNNYITLIKLKEKHSQENSADGRNTSDIELKIE
jgi:hypothetical protein